MRQRTYWVIGAAAIASWWLAAPSTKHSAPSAPSRPAPGYYFEDATLTETDAAGHTVLRLQTRHALQDLASNTIQLHSIAVKYESAPDSTWLLHADHGVMPIGADVISLRGHVELRAGTVTRAAGAIVHTEQMTLDRLHHTASTVEPALIAWPPHELSARGLKLDLTRRTLALENSVHGTFRR